MKPSLKPRVGMIGIGEIEAKEQKRDYEILISGVRNFNIDLINRGIEINTERIEASVRKLLSKRLDVLLIVVLKGMSAQMITRVVEITDCPCIIWAIKGRWAWPSSVLALGALKAEKKRVKLIYGQGDDKDALNEFRESLWAAFAQSKLRQSRIGKIGSLFPNLVSRGYDRMLIKTRLGIEIVEISFNELRYTIETVSEDVNTIEELKRNIFGRFTVKTTEEILIPGMRLHQALKRIANRHKLDAFAVECWSKIPKEIGLNPCLGFIEDDYTLTCEGDVLTCIASQIIRYLTGINPYVGDIYDLDNENTLTLVHCGAPASLSTNYESVIIRESIQAKEYGFPTAVCHPKLKNGYMTVLSLYGKGGDYIHLTSGELIETRENDKLWLKIRLSGKRQEFLKECLANHYIVVPGDVLKELELLCEWLDIKIIRT